VRWLIENERALIDAEFAFNEGGGGFMRGDRKVRIGVQVSEKMPLSFEVEATNAGGHSSLPVPDNAIYDLARASTRSRGSSFPRGWVLRRARARADREAESGSFAAALRAIAAGNHTPRRPAAGLRLRPAQRAVADDLCARRAWRAGMPTTHCQQRARATVNCRLLPRRRWNSSRTSCRRRRNPRRGAAERDAAAQSARPTRLAVMAAIEREASATWPGSSRGPAMSAGPPMARACGSAGIPVYGVLPIFMPDADWAAHARARRAHPGRRVSARPRVLRPAHPRARLGALRRLPR
jgi:acetylornithine deacetylase/succinyl-diaminopimelate desuccinylase-like protein